MNFDDISDALLLIYDILKDDEESKEIIKLIDECENDNDVKKGVRLAVERLNVVDPSVAKEVKIKTKGFAF